jgi:hypothetical protein
MTHFLEPGPQVVISLNRLFEWEAAYFQVLARRRWLA